ncbi:MAG: lipase family protein [Erysipelotrichaceae bacterium]|jgi:hypothetical protein|nr:lipase family protein [Erysipelotrichaceae bacterium]
MKKFKFLALLVIPMLLSGCAVVDPGSSSSDTSSSESSSSDPKIIPGMVEKNVEMELISHFKEPLGESTYKDSCLYSDYWFINDSFDLNYHLATASAMIGAVSYSYSKDNNGTRIASFLEDVGYSNIVKNYYYANGEKLEDSIGGIIGSKKIKNYEGKEYTLLALFPRNAGYGAEWMGNFNIGKEGFHEGFLEARDELLRLMKSYITSKSISGDIKVWAAGYSRGAAVINLVGGFLAEDSGYFGSNVKLSNHDLFVYTNGTPRVVPAGINKVKALSVAGPRGEGFHDTDVASYTYSGKDMMINPLEDNYNCIHNFIANGDYITKLPPSSYSFTRYGVSKMITYGGEEFLKKLEKLSPDTAAKFADGLTYTSEVPAKTIDINKVAIVDAQNKISADEMLESRVASIVSIAKTRDVLDKDGYAELLGALVAAYGIDGSALIDKLSGDKNALIKAGVLAYLTYMISNRGLSDSEALGQLAMDIIEFTGKKIDDRKTYTDQDFLKDLFDFLINDYQTSKDAEQRVLALSKLIPAPYGELYKNVLDYAKKQEIKATYVDDLLLILAGYITENKEDKTVKELIDKAAGLIPADKISMLSMAGVITGKDYSAITDPKTLALTVILDVIECCINGSPAGNAGTIRYFIFSFILPMVVGTSVQFPKTLDLIQNGATSYGEKVVKDSHSLAEIAEEILSIAMPKDEKGNQPSIKELAISTLSDLLELARSEGISKYLDILKDNVESAIYMAADLLLAPGLEYDLQSDLSNALTFIEVVQFVFPAHFSEMYITYLQTKLPA